MDLIEIDLKLLPLDSMCFGFFGVYPSSQYLSVHNLGSVLPLSSYPKVQFTYFLYEDFDIENRYITFFLFLFAHK